MFKNMKLGQKIAFGFISLIVIAVVLGGLSVWNMNNVSGKSAMLAHEYAPEVDIASNLERASRLVMYSNRGYGFTENETYLEEGRRHMEDVKRYMADAEKLAEEAENLVTLSSQIADVGKGVEEYELLVEETVQTFGALNEDRGTLDASARQYMENCTAYLTNQNNALIKEAKSGISISQATERLNKITWINDIIDNGNAVRLAAWRSQAERDPQVIQDALPKFDTIDGIMSDIRKITREDADIKALDNIEQAEKTYKQAMVSLLDNWEKIQDLGNQRNAAADIVLNGSKATADAGIENTVAIAEEANSALSTASTIMIIGLLGAIVLGVLLAVFITKSITGPINKVIEGLTAGAGQVAAASNQVSASSQQMAEGSSEQASSLEEISSSLEEMTSMTRQNAENTQQANTTSDETKTAADKGADAMKRMSEAIGKIKASSDETAKIIKTIDEIAFQTNLLALNAAVEAARAGEAGMGFAVVAEEVRNLAQRSAEAAKDTSSLIEESQNNADNGVTVSNEVADILGEISAAATKVSQLINEVTAASEEQAQGISQVNSAVSQMDQVTQSTAANAEESASASEELSSQAVELNDLVNVLVDMVGGSSNGNGKQFAATTKSAMITKKTMTPKKQSHALIAAPESGKESSPDDIIPLDDDFENF